MANEDELEEFQFYIEDAATPLPATKITSDSAMPTTPEDIKQIINDHVDKVREGMEAHLRWALLEIAHWRQRCEELECELASEDAYEWDGSAGNTLKIKSRRRFNQND